MTRLWNGVLLALVLAASGNGLCAAGKDLKIAMILWRGETEAEKGFRDALKDLGYTTQYTVMNAGQDRGELGRLLREDLRPKLEAVDYVYAYGTTVALAAKNIVQEKTPMIFNIVADPVGAGLVRSVEVSGGNVAGVTNEVPLALQIETALTMMPVKRLGLLFNPREKNSMLIRDRLIEVTRALGIEVVDLRSPPAQDMLQENLQKLRTKTIVVDAIYLPPDSFLASNAQLIGTELRTAGIRSIASLETYVEHGALMGVVPDYYQLGKAAASIIHRHKGGQKFEDMSVEADKTPVLKINATTSRLLGVRISDAVRKRANIVE